MKRLASRCAVLSLVLCMHSAAQSLPGALSAIKAKTTVPVRLPPSVPNLGQGNLPIYFIVDTASRDSYSVIIAFTPDCNGASVCRLGTLTAARVGAVPKGKAVSLAHNIRGTFTEGTCGAGCSDSVIAWRQDGIIYSAGLKAATVKDTAALANLLVSAQPSK